MRLKHLFNISCLLVTIIFSSCYYDKADNLYPQVISCDTSAVVSYSSQVIPLFQQYCYNCHGVSSPSGGLSMGTYASDKAIAVNGKLYGTISYSSGSSPMPKDAPKLTDCQVALIRKWIDANSPNN